MSVSFYFSEFDWWDKSTLGMSGNNIGAGDAWLDDWDLAAGLGVEKAENISDSVLTVGANLTLCMPAEPGVVTNTGPTKFFLLLRFEVGLSRVVTMIPSLGSDS